MDTQKTAQQQRSDGTERRRTMGAENEAECASSILKKCDGVSCNIVGACTVEYCTACDYHDAGVGGFDY